VIFLSGALPGTLLSSLLVNALVNQGPSSHQEVVQLQLLLKWLIIGIIVLTFGLMLHSFLKNRQVSDQAVSTAHHSPRKRVLGWIIAFVIGALIGATSIGGGVLIIPVLTLFFGLTNKQTVGTSILIATVLVAANFVVYGIAGH